MPAFREQSWVCSLCWFEEYWKIKLHWREREDVCFVRHPLWSHIIGVCNAVFIFVVLLNGQYQIRSDISSEEIGFLLHSSTIYAVVFLVNVEWSFFYVCVYLAYSQLAISHGHYACFSNVPFWILTPSWMSHDFCMCFILLCYRQRPGRPFPGCWQNWTWAGQRSVWGWTLCPAASLKLTCRSSCRLRFSLLPSCCPKWRTHRRCSG